MCVNVENPRVTLTGLTGRRRRDCTDSDVQHHLHRRGVLFGHIMSFPQLSLPLCGLGSQDVAAVGTPAFDLPRRGEPETLLGAAFCLHLRHGTFPLRYASAAFSSGLASGFRIFFFSGVRIMIMLLPSMW